MITVIAEKPSVAQDIAKLLGAREKKNGYLSGNGYAVTWAFGHLIQLAMPEAYNVPSFRRESLPIIPDTFQLLPKQIKEGKEYKNDPGVMKQIKIIDDLFRNSEKIIVATDAGREGELIFRYIYQYLNCNKPFQRLWISSLTDKAIQEGFKNLKAGNQYDNLFLSAKARSQADWLVGINASQALTVAAGKGVFSLGRVQTPTLCMICERYSENKNFTPVKYWQLKVLLQKDNIPFSAISEMKYSNQAEALNDLQELKGAGEIGITNVERKEVNQEPPLLYDLTALQKEANSKFGYSADATLKIAQSLYECKYISYPRTGSRYISADVLDEIPDLIKQIGTYNRFSSYAMTMNLNSLNTRSVNDAKVTDHHALIITENIPGNLKSDEKAIYELIASRMLEAFSPKCVKDVTTIVIRDNDRSFLTKGTVIKSLGWRGVFGQQEDQEEETENLPVLSEGEILPVNDLELLEKQTKPKPLHTESSLLAAMESAGKELEDGELKATMKDVAGIGTPATRAGIIETLFSRDYIKREKKTLIPTEKGLAVYDIVKDKKISNVEMTAMWETALTKIESGEMNADTFQKSTEVYTAQITTELLNTQLSINDSELDSPCPKCGSGRILFYPKVAKCNCDECGFIIFRTVAGILLKDEDIRDLITKGKTKKKKGFTGKNGKFDAYVVLDQDHKTQFDFSDSKKKKR